MPTASRLIGAAFDVVKIYRARRQSGSCRSYKIKIHEPTPTRCYRASFRRFENSKFTFAALHLTAHCAMIQTNE